MAALRASACGAAAAPISIWAQGSATLNTTSFTTYALSAPLGPGNTLQNVADIPPGAPVTRKLILTGAPAFVITIQASAACNSVSASAPTGADYADMMVAVGVSLTDTLLDNSSTDLPRVVPALPPSTLVYNFGSCYQGESVASTFACVNVPAGTYYVSAVVKGQSYVGGTQNADTFMTMSSLLIQVQPLPSDATCVTDRVAPSAWSAVSWSDFTH